MNDLVINDPNHKSIHIDNQINMSDLNIKENNDTTMLGVELLANQKNSKADLSVTDSMGYSSGEESHISERNISVNEDYDFFNKIDEKKKDIKKDNIPKPENDPIVNSIKSSESGEFKPIHIMNAQDIKNEKIDLIYKFKRLESQGIRTTMNYNMNSQLDDMRNEYFKLKKQREVENSIKFQRKVMMAAITGLEFLNTKFDPFDIKLDGWSESVNESIIDYDEVFEELAEKYGGKSEMAPEIKLLMMLGGSAFMFHLTNTMFKTSIPGMDDIMKQNPDLMKQFAKAAVGSINPENTNPSVNKTKPTQQSSSQRKNMNGSAGIDDIMKEMKFDANHIPDLDNISLVSGDSDRRSVNSGITLNI